MTLTKMAFHSELEDRSAVILAHLCFLSVEPHPHTQVLPTATAPDVVRELKPKQYSSNDDDTQTPHFVKVTGLLMTTV